jgi:hypothetical protein
MQACEEFGRGSVPRQPCHGRLCQIKRRSILRCGKPVNHRTSWIGNALLFVGSLVVCLGVAEAALRYVIRPRALMTSQVLTRMGVTDADQNWERDPELGWKVRPNKSFRHNNPFGEFDQKVRSDERGLRAPLVETPKPSYDRTILFAGDSMTAAFEVPYEETFVFKVGQALHVNVVNAGVRGYSTEQSLKLVRRLLGEGIHPSDVVYSYSFNDPFENMSLHFPKRYMSKPGAYLGEDGKIKFKSLDHEVGIYDSEALFVTPDGEIGVLPVVDRNATPRRIVVEQIKTRSQLSMWDQLYLVSLTRVAIDVLRTPKFTTEQVAAKYPYIKAQYIPDDFGGFMPGFIDISWEPHSYPLRLLKALILEMRNEVETAGARFWLATPLFPPNETSNFMEELAKDSGVRVINPLRMGISKKWLEQCGGSVVFKTDGHYTACGHSGAAEAVTKALSETASHL